MKPAFLVIDKPLGLTSHDVVAIVRAVTGIKKVGHTGTLDPLASGVLPLALGGATRFIQFLDEQLKVYDATIQFGARTATGDREGEVVAEAPVPSAEVMAGVEAVLAGFLGERQQVPPAYSAVKVDGKPLYKYARQGKTVVAKARTINVYKLTVVERGEDWLRVIMECSRGTYARVLAEEIGQALGSEGHLSALRRLQSGPFSLDPSLSLDELGQLVAGIDDWKVAFRRPAPGEERVKWRPRADVHAGLAPKVTSLLEALSHHPRVMVDADAGRRVLNGGRPPPPPRGVAAGGCYVVAEGSDLLAIAEFDGTVGRCLRAVSAR